MKNSKDPKNITFKVLDLEAGVNGLDSKAGEGFPLENWYRAMQDIPIKDFGIEDICRASRQRVHLDYVVPVA